jgi:hypothetical protein
VPSRMPQTSHDRYPGGFKYTPIRQVRTLFVRFVQGLYSQAPPGSYHWTPEIDKTEIVITDETPIKVEVAGQRPAVSFTRGPLRFYSLGMDDLLDYRQDLDQKTKSVLIPGTMNINCCSRVDLESEDIAWVIAEHIWLLRDLFMKAGFFEVGREIVIGSPTQAGSIVEGDGGEEWSSTQVSCPLQFPRTSKFTPLGKQILRAIELEFSTERRNVASLGVPDQGFELPLGVRRYMPDSFAPGASDARGGSPDVTGELEPAPVRVPHPLNPAAQVTMRTLRPYRTGLREPSLRGVRIPIAGENMKESDVTQPLSMTGRVKV